MEPRSEVCQCQVSGQLLFYFVKSNCANIQRRDHWSRQNLHSYLVLAKILYCFLFYLGSQPWPRLDKGALTPKNFANIVRLTLNLSFFKINSCLRTNLCKTEESALADTWQCIP